MISGRELTARDAGDSASALAESAGPVITRSRFNPGILRCSREEHQYLCERRPTFFASFRTILRGFRLFYCISLYEENLAFPELACRSLFCFDHPTSGLTCYRGEPPSIRDPTVGRTSG